MPSTPNESGTPFSRAKKEPFLSKFEQARLIVSGFAYTIAKEDMMISIEKIKSLEIEAVEKILGLWGIDPRKEGN